MKLVTLNAGVSDPSATRMLADRIIREIVARAEGEGITVTVRMVDLRHLATEIATGLISGLIGPGVEQAIAALAEADGVIAATPVYKATVSGLFTSFIDLVDDDLLIGTPVLLAATAGTARHALVADEALRTLFGYFRALTVPTAVFASAEDWGDRSLADRAGRAATELLALVHGGVRERIRAQAWRGYDHEIGSRATAAVSDGPGRPDGGAGRAEPASIEQIDGVEIALDSELMRLAAGGRLAGEATPSFEPGPGPVAGPTVGPAGTA
ncbi:CE1759 family FMN reductase [Conexibacter sp. DBS9H8]|uniref:CE1759 family FMN reductase n=1 Tax=Conexibacter sp. DBS9H8 TaxID=2937801 RepID=UPI00200E07DB|nr:CE1759 family FMN reductase [Conexibacter sp. DBS9H8]